MRKKIKKFLTKYWRALLVSALCLFFFLGTAGYNYYVHQDGATWSSPDEKANYTFTKLYGQTGELTIFEKYNLVASDIIHPRSFKSEGGFIKPVSFLGIILFYGTIVKLTTYKIIPYLTPFFAAISICYFYLLVKKVFGKNNAIISASMMAFFPPFIYYAARSMFHNVIFVSLLIIGLYYAVLMASKQKKWRNINLLYSVLAGLFIGLAITMRTSELLWLAPALFMLWILNIKKIRIPHLIIFLASLGLAMLPMLYWNQILYSSPAKGGYPEMNQAIGNIFIASLGIFKAIFAGCFSCATDLIGGIKKSIFHFGFQPRFSLKMLYYYFAGMFPWLFYGAILGGTVVLKRFYYKKKLWSYLLPLLIISLILIFYYGSWEFHDNPDPSSFTIGNSYTRYWLPVYLGAMPLASYFLIRLTNILFKKNKTGDAKPKVSFFQKKLSFNYDLMPDKKVLITATRIIVLAVIFYISTNFLLWGSEEGLILSAQRQRQAQKDISKALDLTESDSVIITKYHDKFLFPDRKVIVGNFNEDQINEIYAKLTNFLPVYYYNFTFPDKDMEYLNQTKLQPFNMQIREIKKIDKDFTLYQLSVNLVD